jgi:hypothetical protein
MTSNSLLKPVLVGYSNTFFLVFLCPLKKKYSSKVEKSIPTSITVAWLLVHLCLIFSTSGYLIFCHMYN